MRMVVPPPKPDVKLEDAMIFICAMNFRTFDLNLLRVLDALLVTGSTVGAAERIGLSQPAVSASLQRLRGALNDPLFVRQGQRLEPTDFARSLALPLRSHLDGLHMLLSSSERFDPAQLTQSFRLAGNDLFGELLMPALGAEVARQAPGVRVQLFDPVPWDAEEIFNRYAVDIAFQPRSDFAEWIDSKPLFRSGFALVARKGNSRLQHAGIAEGAEIPAALYCEMGHALMSPEGRVTSYVDSKLAEIGHARTIAMTLPTFSGVYRAVAGSDMLAMLPEALAHKVAPAVGLCLYKPPVEVPGPMICMIWHRRSTSTPAQRWLRGLCADILGTLHVSGEKLPTD